MAEHVDLTSQDTTRWTFRTFNLNLGVYVEWGAETIREKKGGLWGWERRGTARPFTLYFVYPGLNPGDPNRVFSENELRSLSIDPGPLNTVERGYKKTWVFAVSSPAQTDFHESLIIDVIMAFRHRGHGYTLSHQDGLTLVDP
jgi:hypothetical protein